MEIRKRISYLIIMIFFVFLSNIVIVKVMVEDELILKLKNIKFERISEKDAENYLKNNNNYYNLTSYKNNFEKYFVNGIPEVWWIREDSYNDSFGAVKGKPGMKAGSIEALVYEVEQSAKKELARLNKKIALLKSENYYKSRVELILKTELLKLKEKFPETDAEATKLEKTLLRRFCDLTKEIGFTSKRVNDNI